MQNEILIEESPYSAFTMAIRSPITREKYLQRLQYFLSFLGIKEGNIEERCNILGQKAKAETVWFTNLIIDWNRDCKYPY